MYKGAAGKPDNQLTSGITSAATMKFAAATGGFAAITASATSVTVDFIDYTGTTLYSFTRQQQRDTTLYGSESDSAASDSSDANNTPVEEVVDSSEEEEKAVEAVTKDEDTKNADQETYVGTFSSMNVDIRRVVELGVLGITFIAIIAFMAVAKSVFGSKPASDAVVLDVRSDVEAGAVRPGVVTKKMIRMTHARGGVKSSQVLTPGALQPKTQHAYAPPPVPHTPPPATATANPPTISPTVANAGKKMSPAATNVSPVVAANQHRGMNTSRRGLTNHPLLQHR